MRKPSNPAPLLRLAAGLVVVAAAVTIAIQLRAPDALTAWGTADLAAKAVLSLGLAAALLGLASVRNRQEDVESILTEPISRVQAHVGDVKRAVDDVSHQLARTRPAVPGQAAAPAPGDSQQLQQALRLLQEIKDLALLPDDARRERLNRETDERKRMQTVQVIELIEARQYSGADRLLSQLEREFPGDGQIVLARRQLTAARTQVEQTTVLKTRESVEEFMALSSYDQAWQVARQLAEDFPNNADAKALLDRVAREREIYNETTGLRLYEEIRHDIDRRMWRRALMHAERMLEKFPEHRRADAVRGQLKTIQDNAEIEERQEQEVRIQEMLRAHRFQEALELAEELMRRFPMSPQAEAIEQMLPRIKELAEEERQAQGQTV